MLVIFTDQSPHSPSEFLADPFFPSVEDIKKFYSDWKILHEEILTSEPNNLTGGKPMTRAIFLLQNPH